jgi:hypothetical protein
MATRLQTARRLPRVATPNAPEVDVMNDNPVTSAPRPSPETDPTNPCRQETVGEWTAAEQNNERRQGEPGLTDEDRVAREPKG